MKWGCAESLSIYWYLIATVMLKQWPRYTYSIIAPFVRGEGEAAFFTLALSGTLPRYATGKADGADGLLEGMD